MRIATFNLEDFGNARKGNAVFEERAAVLRPQLDRFKADVLCLQEVNAIKVGGTRRPIDLERLLEATSYARHALTISQGPSGDGPADVHNLAVLSRLPIVEEHLIWHSLVEPLHFSSHSAVPLDSHPLTWDRPLQHIVLALPSGRHLHLCNVHLRAPLAVAIQGQKSGPHAWMVWSDFDSANCSAIQCFFMHARNIAMLPIREIGERY